METTTADRVEPQDVADAELTEAEFMYALESAGPAQVRDALGVVTERVAGGVALSMREDPTGGYWNKALGFGVTEPVTGDVLDAVLDVYRANRSTVACLQLAPSVLPEDWADLCGARGIEAGSLWVKLLRDPAPPKPARTDLEVRPVAPEEAREWARVYCAGFGMPEGLLVDLFAGMVDDPDFHMLGVWDGPRLVSSGNVHVKDGRAAFCGVATLEADRGRGAQSALFERRVRIAREAGARVLSAETWAEGPGQHNPSLANMVRAGFRVVYERRNWVWRAP